MTKSDEQLRRKGWRPPNDGHMSFGEAFEFLKRGFHVRRKGWHTIGLAYVFAKPERVKTLSPAEADIFNVPAGTMITRGFGLYGMSTTNVYHPFTVSTFDLFWNDWEMAY